MKDLRVLHKTNDVLSAELIADILSVTKATVQKWERQGLLTCRKEDKRGKRYYPVAQLLQFAKFRELIFSSWEQEQLIQPLRPYRTLELFAGAGGLALGLEQAGLHVVSLNEIDKDACGTLRQNRPQWQVIEADIRTLNWEGLIETEIDLLTGGFPCQAFSYAGEKLGFADTRGTLFFEFARAIKEVQPKVFLGENVRGLLQHDRGRTLKTIESVLSEIGYTLIPPRVLNALFYRVPQKRQRLFLVGIRNDLAPYAQFAWPSPCPEIMTLADALKAGVLYESDVPPSVGQRYPEQKAAILQQVPEGGCWRDLPSDLQQAYLMGSFRLEGGKTGMARRLAWDEPALTLTCSPAQKQTERCHPTETRPLTVREYARIQTFPDNWQFCGSLSSQYRQIGNAVPVNLAAAVGRSLVNLLNALELKSPQPTVFSSPAKQLEFSFA